MRKFYIGLIVGVVILAVFFPISVNFLIGANEVCGFSIKSVMSKDAWLGFWGSYVGAIGAILLGISTYLQSKKYNDMSNHFVEEQKKILENIQALNKQQQITIKANKYYEILENYRDKIDVLATIFEKYNVNWARTFLLCSNDDKVESYVAQYNAMRDDFMSILEELYTDIYFFEGKDLLYDECNKYFELLSIQCLNSCFDFLTPDDFDVNKFNKVQAEIYETYRPVSIKFMEYKLIIESYKKKILTGAKSIEEIQNDFEEMEERHKTWLTNLKETMEQGNYKKKHYFRKHKPKNHC